MVEIKEIGEGDILILENFISKMGDATKTFRYFEKRPPSVIKRHLVTLIMFCDNQPIGYGHLVLENGNNWLGICIIPQFSGKGYGLQVLQALISKGKSLELSNITLTVDKDNLPALSLYHKVGFNFFSDNKNYYTLQLEL